jgi:DHA1 family multidrug resistance protein-like MFS transporter
LGTETLTGLVFSVQALAMAITSPIWGAVADRYGRKMMVMRAMLGGAVTFALMAFVETAEQLILLRAIQGALTGVIAAASALVASACPRNRIGYAMGLLQVGMWSGHSAGPLLGGVLSDLFGIRTTFLFTAALLGLSGLSVWIGIKDPFVRAEHLRNGRFGFLSDWRRIFTTGPVVVTFVQRFLLSMGRSVLLAILPIFVLFLAPDSSRIGMMTGMVVGAEYAVCTLAALYLGRLGDRIGHRKVVLSSAAFAALFYIPQAFAGDPWQLLVLHAVTGIGLGGVIASLSALLAQNSKLGDEGCVYGIDNSVTAAGRVLGPMLGASLASWFSLRTPFLSTGLVFGLIAVIAAFSMFRYDSRNKNSVKEGL